MELRKEMSEEELEEFLFRRLVLKVGAQIVKRGDCYFPLPSERASCCGRSNSLTHFYSFEHVTHLLSRFMRDADLKVNRFIVDLVYMKVYIHADRDFLPGFLLRKNTIPGELGNHYVNVEFTSYRLVPKRGGSSAVRAAVL